MNILIVGAGSLGMMMAGKLTGKSGHYVQLVTRTAKQSRIMTAEQLQIEEEGRESLVRVSCYSFEEAALSVSDDSSGFPDWDWIFLMVKQIHIDEALMRYIQNIIGKRTMLLCFQNGIGHVEKLTSFISPEKIMLAVTTEGVKKTAGNRVVHTGTGSTWIGRAVNQADGSHKAENMLQKLVKFMKNAGFPTFLSNNMESLVWNKLIINAAINPLTAILRIRNGELLSPERMSLMRILYDEAKHIAESKGIATAPDLWEQLLSVCRKTAANSSSMLQDILEHRCTEIDYINGSIISAAKDMKIQVPTHQAIYYIVKAMECGSR